MSAVAERVLNRHGTLGEDRGAIAKMVMTMLAHWKLSTEDQAALLGIAATNRSALARYRNGVKGQFPPRYETAGQLAGLMTQMFWYNFDESFINNFEKNVDGLTLDKAKQIIAKYFPKDKLQLVLVGKSADIKKIAEKYGPVTEVQIKEEVKKAF